VTTCSSCREDSGTFPWSRFPGKGTVFDRQGHGRVRSSRMFQPSEAGGSRELRARLAAGGPEPAAHDRSPLDPFMRSTDWAVVISQSRMRIPTWPHAGSRSGRNRNLIVEELLDDKFQDPEDRFRLAFVCSMWTTGFTVPVAVRPSISISRSATTR